MYKPSLQTRLNFTEKKEENGLFFQLPTYVSVSTCYAYIINAKTNIWRYFLFLSVAFVKVKKRKMVKRFTKKKEFSGRGFDLLMLFTAILFQFTVGS